MARLKLFLLGSPRIELDGSTIGVDTRKAIALLVYLAVTGERHRRDALAALLWPDADQTHARAALRRTLSTLNKAIAETGLRVEREAISLDRDSDVWVDVVRFQVLRSERSTHPHPKDDFCRLCVTALTEAATLYHDDFLAGFGLRDSPGFDDWQLRQTEMLRRELTRTLQQLAHCHSVEGSYEQALGYARRWLSLDPMDESAHRQLMLLHCWAGERPAALSQYRECLRVLEQELGVPPLEETTQLYQAIRENRAPPPPTPRAQLSVPSERRNDSRTNTDSSFEATGIKRPPCYPLVGRSGEWEALLQVYNAISTDGILIVLEGEAGIGKTRLAEEFVAHARARGATTIIVRCYEGEAGLVYGPFVEALRAVTSQGQASDGLLEKIPPDLLSEVARLLPELSARYKELPQASPLNSPGAQSRFFEAITRILMAACRGMLPGVLFIDDLQWADDASLDLLTYLVRRLHGRPLCVLATWRDEYVTVEHRLRMMLSESRRAGMGTLLSLSRLDLSAVTELVQTAVAENISLPDRLAEYLYRETEGLPFFLVEYLATITDDPDPGMDNDWSMPTSVRDLLLSRLSAVSETGRQLLDSAAVIGRYFDFETVHRASGRSDEEIIYALEELIARGFVNEYGGDGTPIYDFSHEQLRVLVYEVTSLARRRLLHRRVAEALAVRPKGRHDTSPVASLIAQHYHMAGLEMEAAEYFKLAGGHARALFANAESLSHFRSALELGHHDAAELHEVIGDLQTLQGDYGAALASYETAAALCEAGTLGKIEHKLGVVHHRLGQWDLADSHFGAALGALGEIEASAEHARLYADWSLNAYRRGDTPQAQYLSSRAFEHARVSRDTRALAEAHNMMGVLARSQGKLGEACHHLELSLKLAESLDDPSARVAALNNLALARGASGDLEGAIDLAETGLTLCASQGDRHREAALHNNLADLLHAAGRSDDSMSHLKQAVTIFTEIGAEAGDMQPEIWKLVEW